jgi:hypothetical protein
MLHVHQSSSPASVIPRRPRRVHVLMCTRRRPRTNGQTGRAPQAQHGPPLPSQHTLTALHHCLTSKGCWHYVRGLTVSLSLNFWF